MIHVTCIISCHDLMSCHVTNLTLPRCGLGAGLCDKVCASVSVAEDRRCQCGCLEDTCDPTLHRVHPQTCQCECKQVRSGLKRQGNIQPHHHCRSLSMCCVGSRAGCGTPGGVSAPAPAAWSNPAHPVNREKITRLLINCLDGQVLCLTRSPLAHVCPFTS